MIFRVAHDRAKDVFHILLRSLAFLEVVEGYFILIHWIGSLVLIFELLRLLVLFGIFFLLSHHHEEQSSEREELHD